MLKDGLLHENIDGEALLWAASRLARRRERRKLLMVISDGAPADLATLEANDHDYLARHLRHAITTITNAGVIELSAIGIRHDVDRFYPSAVRIDHADMLGPAMLSQLGDRLRSQGPQKL